MFEIGIVAQFEAAHRLRGDFGPATRLHGHTYRMEVAVRGESLGADGTLCDAGALQGVVQEVVGGLHYRELDALPLFAERNTTVEVVAQTLWEAIAPRLETQGLVTLLVRVWESPQVYASYEHELG